MAANPLFEGNDRPARAAHLGVGLFSPMWLPFMAMAGMGAAMWTLQNWPRMMTGMTGARPGGAPQTGAAATTDEAASVVRSYQPPPEPAAEAAPPQVASAGPVPAALEPVIAQGFAVETPVEPMLEPVSFDVESTAEEHEPPQPLGEALAAAASPSDLLDKSLAVQGEDDAPDVQPVQIAAPEPEPEPRPVPEPVIAADAHTSEIDDDKPEPTLPPHEGLPARRKGGGRKRQAI